MDRKINYPIAIAKPQPAVSVAITVTTNKNPQDTIESMLPTLADELSKKIIENFNSNSNMLHVSVKEKDGTKQIRLGVKLLTGEKYWLPIVKTGKYVV